MRSDINPADPSWEAVEKLPDIAWHDEIVATLPCAGRVMSAMTP